MAREQLNLNMRKQGLPGKFYLDQDGVYYIDRTFEYSHIGNKLTLHIRDKRTNEINETLVWKKRITGLKSFFEGLNCPVTDNHWIVVE